MSRSATRRGDSDWDLLARVAAGEQELFRILVERHQDRLIALCRRLLHDPEEARDAAQEVFVKAFRKAGRLEPRGQLYTWLYRVAVNHCLNRLRRRRLVRFLPLTRTAGEAEPDLELDPPDAAADPLAELEIRRRWQATREAIGGLPPSQRAVLILARWEGLSYREIAETMEITVKAVESRLVRAMRHLRRAQDESGWQVSRGDER